jgi:hypothetical protein
MIAVGPGVKQTVTERGYFAPPFTACRFAVIAQILLRMGYQVPLERKPGADNFVLDLQLAGDNTPKNGSSMRQGQKAVAALLPDAPVLFGTITDTEMFDAVGHGATVGFAVNMGKMPRELKNFCGYGFNGGHYMAVDAAYGGVDGFDVDLNDPMYRPAKNAQPRRVAWNDIKDAIVRDGAGNLIVTLGFQDAAWLRSQLAIVEAHLTEENAVVVDLEASADSLRTRIAAQTI